MAIKINYIVEVIASDRILHEARKETFPIKISYDAIAKRLPSMGIGWMG